MHLPCSTATLGWASLRLTFTGSETSSISVRCWSTGQRISTLTRFIFEIHHSEKRKYWKIIVIYCRNIVAKYFRDWNLCHLFLNFLCSSVFVWHWSKWPKSKRTKLSKAFSFQVRELKIEWGGKVRSYLFKAMKTTEPNPACRLTSTKFIMYVHNSFLG